VLPDRPRSPRPGPAADRPTTLMDKRARLLAWLSCTWVSVGLALSAPAAASSPPAVMSPTAMPTGEATQCPPDERDTGPAGTPGLGTLESGLPAGRVLMTVGSLVGDAGVFAVEVIDSSGIHVIDTPPDWTMNALQWESPQTAIFDSERAGQRHLFRLHLDDGSVEQITSGPAESQGQVSVVPDGRLVHEAWSCTTGLYLGLHVTSADGSQTAEITDPQVSADSGDDEQPDVSPDGRSVAFVRQVGDGSGAIFTVPVDGGPATRLTDDIGGIARPRWSPDGSTILIEVSGTLWTVPTSGGERQRIADCPAYCWEGDWSPDGSHILFKDWVYGADHVDAWIAAADGSDARALWVGDHSSAEQPDWGA
jgi:hypothetical protein